VTATPPVVEPRRPGGMRTGYTTGACATAAATAALRYLLTGTRPDEVTITLPAGQQRVTFALDVATLEPSAAGQVARCAVIKDGGDDPDVTHGAQVVARVWRSEAPGLTLLGGEGVGTVTRPGLGLEVGGPAINPVPRRMLTEAITTLVPDLTPGVVVEISIPGGEELAQRTLNPRLGIVGGLSILGTTGIVRPFSTAAWRASVSQAVDVAAANGADTVILATGGRSERYAQELLGLPEIACVEAGEFTGHAVRRAQRTGIARAVIAGMVGKFAKMAQGHLMTHVAGNQVDTTFLAHVAADCGADAATLEVIRGANTARHVQEIIVERGVAHFFDRLAADTRDHCIRATGSGLEVSCLLFDFDGTLLGRAGDVPFPTP
jgi:cobalt-precorrin-5B (C1)-methyltransferase